jgi:hypothetical protein
MKCKICGKELPIKLTTKAGKKIYRKFCPDCCPFDPSVVEEYERTKTWAEQLINLYPERIVVLAECFCGHDKVHRHHPDYTKPFEIYKMCVKCHHREHYRVNKFYNTNIRNRLKNTPTLTMVHPETMRLRLPGVTLLQLV